MASYNRGKKQVCKMLKDRFQIGDSVLDIGACNGKWYNLLSNYFIMDAVEVWKPYILRYNLLKKYNKLFIKDICDCEDFKYDVIIMGDVLEHIDVKPAQKIIQKMYNECNELIVAIPYTMKQGEVGHNPYQIHRQSDLTHEIFMKRYPGFKLFWGDKRYGYYIKDKKVK